MSIAIPCTNSVSLILPPTFFSTFMLSTSTTLLPLETSSATALSALIAISARKSRDASAALPVIAVSAIFFSSPTSSISISFPISSSTFFAFSAASRYPNVITVGCSFSSSRSSAFFSSSAPRTTAVVVPSPATSSTVFATSTIIFAAGLSMSISLRIVTPSFVITTSPRESTSILSIPFGPNVVRTASPTAFAAFIFAICASLPFVRSLPAFNTNIGIPPNCPAILHSYLVSFTI